MTTEKEIIDMVKGLGFLVIVGVFAVPYFMASSSTTQTSQEPEPASCRTDWHLCTDNADLVEHHRGFWVDASANCKIATENMAKYGYPEMPWGAFGSFKAGNDYPKTGVATLVEPKVGFKNSFNATVWSRVECDYDMNTKKVIKVRVS